MSHLLARPPVVEFRPAATRCCACGGDLKVLKTRTRTVSTLHVGPFQAQFRGGDEQEPEFAGGCEQFGGGQHVVV